MPDFNLRNDDVLSYLESVMKFWLDLDLDGFRIDAISHGIEVLPDATTGKYPDEDEIPGVEDKADFGFLNHTLTQDQPKLFDIIYAWRKFLDDYQDTKKSDTK
jgi:glycosidase